MIFKPHQYQQYCIDRILDTNRIGLFLAMGLGKTVTTLTAIHSLKYERFLIRKTLVIAPKKVAEGTWQDEIERWDHLHNLRVSTVLGTLKERTAALNRNADIYIINRENVVWLVNFYKNDWPFDMVVVDESSSFKSHTAKRFRALAAVSNHIRRMVLLTGTPSPNGMLDLWSQVYLLDGGERLGKRYGQFRERYFAADRRSPEGIVYNYKIKPGGEDAILKKISDICISMKSEDYLTLPDVIENTIPVVLDSSAQKKYKELERQMVMEMEDEDDITVTSAAALSNKLLQLANGAVYDEYGSYHEIHDCKLEALDELVESLQGHPLLLFYSYKSDKERILRRMKNKKIRSLDCDADVKAWNNHELDILLAHPASCAYGLNLQHGGNHVCWFGLTWNYELYAQANKRLHRQGQTEKVIIHHLICKGTRDEAVMKALENKDTSQAAVMESLKAAIKEVKSGNR